MEWGVLNGHNVKEKYKNVFTIHMKVYLQWLSTRMMHWTLTMLQLNMTKYGTTDIES